ncbi:hypothetical protein EMCRGX_G012457 [Ephydatia muelleri]
MVDEISNFSASERVEQWTWSSTTMPGDLTTLPVYQQRNVYSLPIKTPSIPISAVMSVRPWEPVLLTSCMQDVPMVESFPSVGHAGCPDLIHTSKQSRWNCQTTHIIRVMSESSGFTGREHNAFSGTKYLAGLRRALGAEPAVPVSMAGPDAIAQRGPTCLNSILWPR